MDNKARMKEVTDKLTSVFQLAKQHYGIDLSNIPVSYNLRGGTAGKACAFYRKDAFTRRKTYYDPSMKLNREMINSPDDKAYRHLVDDTIPHEIAHLVCMMVPSLGGNSHNHVWKNVCRRLGGNGTRCHDIYDQPVGKGLTYEYTSTGGKSVALSKKKHLQVQAGFPIFYRRKSGVGLIDRYCSYKVKDGHTYMQTVTAPPRVGPLPNIRTAQRPPRRGGRTIINIIDFMFGGGKPLIAQRPVTQQPIVSRTAPVNRMLGNTAPRTITKAEQVRDMIRAAKRINGTQVGVIGNVMATLGMPRGQATKYVTENWERA